MKKNKYILLLTFILFFFSILSIYGDDVFYALKTYLYRNKALEVDIKIEKNDDINNLNVNFVNQGSCDVFLRGFVFAYFIDENERNNGTSINNKAITINYNRESQRIDENYWYIGNDNYIYYTKVLKVGKRTEKPLAESIVINLSDEEKDLLKDKKIAVDIIVEAVQMNNFAYKYEWEITDDVLKDYFKNSDDNENSEGIEVFRKDNEVRVIIQ